VTNSVLLIPIEVDGVLSVGEGIEKSSNRSAENRFDNVLFEISYLLPSRSKY
jgi:hypothetical protein